MEGHSTEDILKALSDSKSLDMFRSIAKGSVESEVLKDTKGLSKKQYYLRTRHLLKTGLIKRNKGSLFTYHFGCCCISCPARCRKGSQ